MSATSLIEERATDSQGRLDRVRDALASELAPIERTSGPPEVCIYATGSLARLEATEHSDLDAFFLLSGSEQKSPLSRIRDVKILNAVVNAAETSGFPEFSNEGEYLQFLYIDDMLAHIGGRGDDYHNAFTGRVLMVLEGKHLYNERAFLAFRSQVVDTYFKDFHDHAQSFRPIFLLNDILRFWRTLCINYENSRHWRKQSAEKRARGHLDNLKLRFSRLNICYSFICHLLAQGKSLAPENVIRTADLTPLARLDDLKSAIPELTTLVDGLLEEYGWFLDAVGKEKTSVLRWIDNEENRREAFNRGNRFVGGMSRLVNEVALANGYLRYLLV